MRSNGSSDTRVPPPVAAALTAAVRVRTLAKRHPWAFVAGVAVTGFVLGRLLARLWRSR